ncbi:ROK family protein [Streptomyces sp. NPDC059272]|uniref:ROK family transcriptional regulator n=1 Tax=Streptomyces sp. NPDC059272 TaxID=3346800 RepID=UPI0036861B55
MNDRAVLDLLLEHGALSRSRIGALAGLSRPTASQLLARLEAAGLVLVRGMSRPGTGRPGQNAPLYALNPRAAYAAGVDVTPERIRAAVADVTGTVVGKCEVPTLKQRAWDVIGRVTGALDGAVREAGLLRTDVRRVVIGTPGAFDPSFGRLRYASHLPGWHSPTLLEELAVALPAPVEYDNDVNLVALAEQRAGAARRYENFVLLWNGEGLGAALVMGGRPYRGSTGGAGEIGFLPVPGVLPVRRVAQVNGGGFQELAGAQVLPGLARELGITDVPDGPCLQVASTLLRRAAQAVTGPYLTLLTAYATRLATGLASMVAVLDPELVVLAGSAIIPGGEPLLERVTSEFHELAAPRPELVLGEVTDDPVRRGALECALAATRDEVFDTSD